MYVGDCVELSKPDPITADYNKLTEELIEEGLFEPKKWYFFAILGHILALEALGQWYAMSGGFEWGGYVGYFCLAFVLAIAQAQAGWLQHDCGHLSIFKTHKHNLYAHKFVMSHLRAACTWWWTECHSRHHAKTGILSKDPDTETPLPFFVFDEKLLDLEELRGDQKPIHFLIPFQKVFFLVFGPWFVTTVVLMIQNIVFVIKNNLKWDALWMASYFIRFGFQYGPYIGFLGCVKLYFATRLIETHSFMYITSMSHLPCPILPDERQDWVTMQMSATQNVDPGYFNDWVTGSMNYQIEHHLWPTMPKHNFHKVSDRVKALAKKHGIEYKCVGLFAAFGSLSSKLDQVSEEFARRKNGESMKKMD